MIFIRESNLFKPPHVVRKSGASQRFSPTPPPWAFHRVSFRLESDLVYGKNQRCDTTGAKSYDKCGLRPHLSTGFVEATEAVMTGGGYAIAVERALKC